MIELLNREIMANSYESTVDELMNELKDLNESSIQAAENGCALPKSQINVLSTDFNKIVITFDVILLLFH
jgi:hypothetical protein